MTDEMKAAYLSRAWQAERRARETQDEKTSDLWREIAQGYRQIAAAMARGQGDGKAA